MTLGLSSLALPMTAETMAPKPTLRRGNRSKGTINMVMRVRRSRKDSVSSLRYTIPMLRVDMSVGLRGNIVRSDDFDENFLEVVFRVFIAKLGEGAFGKKFSGLDDADGVAEFFDFGHDVGGEDDGFAAVAALADELDDGARGHNVETAGGFVEDHDWRVVDECAGNGGFLLLAGGEFVAAAVAEFVHVQAVENFFDALFEGSFVQTVEAAEIFDKFLGSEARVQGGGGGEKPDAGADFFGIFDDVVTADDGGAIGGLEDGSEHTEGGR